MSEKALQPVIDLTEFPNSVVDVFIDLPQTDAGSRCAGISAAAIALADAGVPMRDLVVGLSGGKIDGTLVIDLCGKEDNYSDADVPIAFLPNKNEITLLQMDGRLTPEETKTIIRNVLHAGKKVYEKQVETLRKKYSE